MSRCYLAMAGLHPVPRIGAMAAALMLSTLCPAPAVAATYTVGIDAACSHFDIEAALESARTNPGPDTIRISHLIWYDLDLTTTANADLDILGGYLDCTATEPDGTRTTLRGDTEQGGTGDQEPVIRLQVDPGVVVRIRRLRITKGDQDGDGKGGGINLTGGGTLEIADSSIDGNLAGYGGGIHAEHTGGPELLHLVIGPDTTINANTARYSGGGIYMHQATRLTMTAPGSLVAFNQANGVLVQNVIVGGYGGGIRLFGRTIGHLGSSGQGSLGMVYGNEARFGGGVAISNDEFNQIATLRLFTTDPAQPGAIRSNFARVAGGGIYAQPYKAIAADADQTHVRIYDANVEDNAAPQGAAIHLAADSDSAGTTTGADLFINNEARPAGAVGCAAGVICSRIGGNDNVDENNTPVAEATIYVGDDASARINRARLEDNSAGELIRGNSAGDGIGISIQDSLITGNQVSKNIVRTNGDSPVALRRTTIVDNAIAGSAVLSLSDSITIKGAIVWQQGKPVLAAGGGTRDIEDVLANEIASLSGGARLLEADPRFADPSRNDWRLRAASPAVDYAPTQGGPDLEGRARGIDLAIVPDLYGASDLGAYERQSVQPLVLNADFAGDLHLWTTPPGHAAAYNADNAPGSPAGTGSVLVSGSSVATYLLGPLQCLHVPGPGSYRLNGWGHSQGINASLRNAISLIWELRADGGEGCLDGAISASGQHYMSGLSAWSSPSDPTVIEVSEALWNTNTSLTILPLVYPNSVNTDFNGWFDRITLEVDVSALPFADGFENP